MVRATPRVIVPSKANVNTNQNHASQEEENSPTKVWRWNNLP
jgi:hypothetical protein